MSGVRARRRPSGAVGAAHHFSLVHALAPSVDVWWHAKADVQVTAGAGLAGVLAAAHSKGAPRAAPNARAVVTQNRGAVAEDEIRVRRWGTFPYDTQ